MTGEGSGALRPRPPGPPESETPDLPQELAAAAPVVWRFQFRGTAAEFFRIWSVNLLLTFATLGLFSPWAKVRARRYFYGSAFLNGANFDYHASPWSILVARICVILVVIGGAAVAGEDLLKGAVHTTLLALLLPWALVRGFAFNARYSSHRGARFAFKKQTAAAYALFFPLLALFILPGYVAYFSAESGPSSGAAADGFGFFSSLFVALLGALALVCLALAPVLMREWHDFKARNHSVGPVQFHFDKPGVLNYCSALWGVPVLGIAALALVVIPLAALASAANSPSFAIVVLLTGYLGLFLVSAFVRAKLFHLFWNSVRFSIGDESGRFRADFSLWDFAAKILVVNYVAIVLSLGLLLPWAKIRRARFIAEHLSLETTPAALDKIPGLRGQSENPLGEEFEGAEGFDFDVGLV